jgi:uncharacterized protein
MSTESLEMDELRRANTEIVRRFIAAINDAWNIEAMRELVSEDFLFEIPFAPAWFRVRYAGRAEALAFMDTVRDIMDPENLHDLRVDTLAADPAEVVAQYKSATRMRSTGLPYGNDYIGRFTVREGRIRYFAEYLDPCRFVVAIGGRVEPPGPGHSRPRRSVTAGSPPARRRG